MCFLFIFFFTMMGCDPPKESTIKESDRALVSSHFSDHRVSRSLCFSSSCHHFVLHRLPRPAPAFASGSSLCQLALNLKSSLTSSSRPGTPSFRVISALRLFAPQDLDCFQRSFASTHLQKLFCSLPLCRLIPCSFETFFCCLSLLDADSNS